MIVLRSRKKRTCKLKLSKSEKLPDDYMSSSLTQEVSRIYPLFNTSLESFDDEKFDLSYQLSTVPMFKLNLELCDTKSSCLSYHSEPTITTKLESCDTESSYLSNQPSKELIVSRNLESCDTESQPSIEQTVSRNLESCDTESSYASHQPSIEQTISRNLESCDTENSYFSNQLSMEPLISRTINSFDNNEYSVDSIQRSSSPTLHTYKTDRKFEQFPNLHKSFEYTSKNITTELFVNHGTQTLELKPCNMTDIFGQRYQYSCCLGRNNRTLTWERSDCKLTLPSSAVEEHNVEVHTSTFDDIPAICEKMSLSTDTRISSPVVEYRLTDSEKLDDFALVQIPYVGEMKEIEIWKCPSDSGMHQKLERVKVPVLEKENNEYDCFCVLENGRARVYTKSFSVFFCTKHQTERNDFCLQAFLFGSFKKILDKYEVTLSLYIADELHKFTDYNQVSIYQYIPGYFVLFV